MTNTTREALKTAARLDWDVPSEAFDEIWKAAIDAANAAEAKPDPSELQNIAQMIVDKFSGRPDDYAILIGAPMKNFNAYIRAPLGEWRKYAALHAPVDAAQPSVASEVTALLKLAGKRIGHDFGCKVNAFGNKCNCSRGHLLERIDTALAAPQPVQDAAQQEPANSVLIAWIEEAVNYVGCDTWSPSLEVDGRRLLSRAIAKQSGN